MELLPKAGMFGAFELLALQRIVIFFACASHCLEL
jgi:hypothetical protein